MTVSIHHLPYYLSKLLLSLLMELWFCCYALLHVGCVKSCCSLIWNPDWILIFSYTLVQLFFRQLFSFVCLWVSGVSYNVWIFMWSCAILLWSYSFLIKSKVNWHILRWWRSSVYRIYLWFWRGLHDQHDLTSCEDYGWGKWQLS